MRSKHIKTTYYYITLSIAALFILLLSQQTAAGQTETMATGRENPFAQISRPSTNNPLANLFDSPENDEEKPELFVQTVMLKFLDAKSLRDAIESMSSEYGSITINQMNNSLVICDTKKHLEWILNEIAKADKTPQQILVEVVIVDVQLNDATEMGINWDILSDKNYDIGYRQNFTDRLGSTIADTDNIGNATAFNTTGIGGDFSVISGTIRNVLSMLQQKRNVEILASPRTMMLSGHSSSIKAVEEIPYNEVSDTAAGGAAAITTTKFKEVGITLQVDGTITDEDNIFLTIQTETNIRTGASATGVPIIDTRQADTELLLQDGQIVVMGGLRRQETTNEIHQIPILGDLPVIGPLFRSTETVVKDTELIVFISPHISKEGDTIPEQELQKYNEIKNRPMLSLPENAKLSGYRRELAQYFEQQNTPSDNIPSEQLQQIISDCEQVEWELQEYRDRLEQRLVEQNNINEKLQESYVKNKQVEDELVEYRIHIDNAIKEQSDINRQLELQINEAKDMEAELKKDHKQIELRLEEQTSNVETLQYKTTNNQQSKRETTKKELFDRIKVLRDKKDKNSKKELLSALVTLDKILSKEIDETLNLSEDALSENLSSYQ